MMAKEMCVFRVMAGFLCGMITVRVSDAYGWWSLAIIPFFVAIDQLLKIMIEVSE